MGDVRINAKSTLSTLNKWIEVVSGNLVGAQIYGYKGTRISFGDSLVDTIRNGTATTTIGGLNPIQLSSGGISVGSTSTDFRQGSIVQTGDNAHLAISGNAWFAVANPAGSINYTRNGEFHFDDAGNFVTDSGNFVMGVFDSTKQITPSTAFSTMTNKAVQFTGMNGLAFAQTSAGAAQYGSTTFQLCGSGQTLGTSASQYGGVIPFSSLGNAAPKGLKYFLDDPNAQGDQDRAIGTHFVQPGQIYASSIFGSATTNSGQSLFLFTIITNETVPQSFAITIDLTPNVNNNLSNTAYDNAVLIANAVNKKANRTGVGASVVRDRKDPFNKVSLVFTNIQRTLTEDFVNYTASLPDGNPYNDLFGRDIGVLGNFKDNQGNVFHKINIKTMIASSPEYRPLAGDRFSFDGTGQMTNNSRGKDALSAPPFASGVHVAITKFSNQDGLQKIRGSSQFTYSDAAGLVIVGYAGMDKTSQVSKDTGLQITGASTIGSENNIIPQSLESSNTSITEMLPELTIAQKTFTSNSKVVNVGNSVVDDLNGLIR
jgi:flagellar hook-basal body protein